VRPRTGVVHQDHQANRGAAKNIEGVEAVVQVRLSFDWEDTKVGGLGLDSEDE